MDPSVCRLLVGAGAAVLDPRLIGLLKGWQVLSEA